MNQCQGWAGWTRDEESNEAGPGGGIPLCILGTQTPQGQGRDKEEKRDNEGRHLRAILGAQESIVTCPQVTLEPPFFPSSGYLYSSSIIIKFQPEPLPDPQTCTSDGLTDAPPWMSQGCHPLGIFPPAQSS